MVKIHKISLSYLCCFSFCSTSFSSPNPGGWFRGKSQPPPPHLSAHVTRRGPPRSATPVAGLNPGGRTQDKPKPHLSCVTVHDAGATLADWGRSKLEPLPPRSATPVIFDLPPPPFDGFEAEAPVDYPVIKVQFQSLGYGNLSDTRLETLKLFLGFAHKEFCLRPELLLPLRRGSIPMVGGSLSQPFIGADFKATIIMGFSKFVTCRICNEEHLGKMGMRHAASKHVPTEAMLEGRDQACEGQFDLGAIHGLLSPKAQQQLESFNRWLVSDKAKRAFQNLEDSSSVVCIKQEALLYMFVGSCFPFVKFIEAKQGKSAIKLCFYAKLPQDIGWGSSDIKKGYFLKKDHRSQFVRIILGYSPVNPELHFFSCYPIPESVFLLTARQFHLEVD